MKETSSSKTSVIAKYPSIGYKETSVFGKVLKRFQISFASQDIFEECFTYIRDDLKLPSSDLDKKIQQTTATLISPEQTQVQNSVSFNDTSYIFPYTNIQEDTFQNDSFFSQAQNDSYQGNEGSQRHGIDHHSQMGQSLNYQNVNLQESFPSNAQRRATMNNLNSSQIGNQMGNHFHYASQQPMKSTAPYRTFSYSQPSSDPSATQKEGTQQRPTNYLHGQPKPSRKLPSKLKLTHMREFARGPRSRVPVQNKMRFCHNLQESTTARTRRGSFVSHYPDPETHTTESPSSSLNPLRYIPYKPDSEESLFVPPTQIEYSQNPENSPQNYNYNLSSSNHRYSMDHAYSQLETPFKDYSHDELKELIINLLKKEDFIDFVLKVDRIIEELG